MSRRRAAAGLAAVLGLGAACAPGAPGAAPQVTTTLAPVITAAPLVTIAAPTGSALVLAEARRFVFRVRNDACLATGTAFSFGGAVVTNRHVAAGASSVDLATWDGNDFTATVEGHSTVADLALLAASPPGPASSPPAGPADPPVGTTVYVAGYPEGNALTVSSGEVVNSVPGSGFGLAGSVLEVTDRVEPGNSGSPLLDRSGRLVGVVFAIDLTSGEGLAMPLSTLRSFLGTSPTNASIPCPSD